MFKNRLQLTPAMFLSAIIMTLNGCGWKSGPARVAIDGVVLVSGAPLKDGRISFIPAEETTGPVAVARVVAGNFRFNSRTGPVVGKHKVRIESILDLGFPLDDERAYANAVREKADTGESVLPRQPIPPEYNDQTELSVEISTKGSRHYEFQIEGPVGGSLGFAAK